MDRSGAVGRPVFLSYASQDADAARRICDALRAASVEVWFDQSELRGGDAWDAKIRKQIKECALFVPIISSNTQARREGYFRLEWRLADQRTHLMSHDTPFIVPVVIDETSDHDARVPESFQVVQWTRLPEGRAPEGFCARVQSLLAGNGTGPSPQAFGPPAGGKAASSARRTPRRWRLMLLAATATVALVLGGLGWWQLDRPPRERRASPTLTKSEQLVATARSLYEPWDLASTDDFRMADGLLKQATEMDPLNADAWASLAILSYGQGVFGFDSSNARLELLRTSAERAVKLAPASDRAKFAQALRFRRAPGLAADALQLMRELADRNPNDRFILRQVGSIVRAQGKREESLIWYDRAAALPGSDPIAVFMRAQTLHELDRLDEAEAAFEQVLIKRPDFARAHDGYLAFLLFARGDLERVKGALQKLPARALSDERVAMDAAWGWYLARDPVWAAAALRHITQDYVEAFPWHSPKSYLVGCVHQLAGRQEAAVAEWRVAAQIIEKRLATDPNDIFDRYLQVELMALLGNRPAAEAALRGFEEFEASQSTYSLLNWQIYALLGQEEKLAAYFSAQFQRGRSNARIGEHHSFTRRTFAAIFRFHPYLDPYRDRARFRELAAEADRFFDRPSDRGSEPKASVSQAPGPKSIAVLAFDNRSDDKSNEYFSDGLSEELINRLGSVSGLTVRGPTSSFYFKSRKDVSSAEIARQLGVEYLVRGSVSKSGNQVRIAAQLTRAVTDELLWSSEPLVRPIENAWAVQEEIAGLIARNLSLRLGTSSVAATAAVDPRVLELYLQGRQAWNLRTAPGYDRAEEFLQRALTLDPKFAPAHAALADVWMLRGQTGEAAVIGRFDHRNSAESARILAKAREAVALDPNSAEARASLGGMLWLMWNFTEAENEMRRAVSLNPNYAYAHQVLGRVLQCLGRMDEALAELKTAAELDPLSTRTSSNYALALVVAGRFSEALSMYDRALAVRADESQALGGKATLLARLGRFEEALAIVKRLGAENALGAHVLILAEAGLRGEAEALVNGSRSIQESRVRQELVLGRRAEAIALLDAGKLRATVIAALLFDSDFDAIRSEPRFAQMLVEVGAGEAHRRAQVWRAAHPLERPTK